jgi:predicted AAA+ superfamily ATPase
MDNILSFLLDNISNLTTTNKVSSRLNSDGVSIDHKTVGNYISYLCSGYVFHKIKRYDIKGSLYLQTNEKYYCIDQSFRLAKLGTRYFDFGRIYENIVAIELLRRGYEVYVGKLYQKEIDFVAIKGSEKLYIQVADNIENPDTLEREIAPLKAIRESYPKFILANTKHLDYDIGGIRIIDLSSWLLSDWI